MSDLLFDEFVVNRGSHKPPYSQIRDHIIDCVRKGVVGGGERLPSTTQLRKVLGVAHATLNRSIQDLKRDGWVTAVKGGGIYVAAHFPERQDPALARDSLTLRTSGVPMAGSPRPWSELLNQLQHRVPGVDVLKDSDRPDICPVYSPVLPCLADDLEDLTDVLLPSLGRRDLDDPILAPLCYGGKLLGVAQTIDVLALVLDLDRFSEAGVPLPTSDWTFEEMTEVAAELHRPDRGECGLAVSPNYLNYMYFLWREQGEFFSDDGRRCTLDSPAALRAMRRMSDLTRMGPASIDPEQRSRLVTRGRPAMQFLRPAGLGRERTRWSHAWSVVCLPEYRRAIVPMEVNGCGLVRGSAAREAGLHLLGLYPKIVGSPGSDRLVPLAIDRSREEISRQVWAFRESLRHARHAFANIPAELRSMKHDVALNLFSDQCEKIVFGDPDKVAERMRTIADHMTSVVNADKRVLVA